MSSRQSLWKISIRIASEAEDAVTDALAEIFGQPASIYADTEKRITSASVFLPKFDRQQRAAVRAALARIRAAGLNTGSGRISARRIARENWAESWKRHFKPLEISARLLILPSWSNRRAKQGQAVVILDPGLSFGTGHHPTTAFCLEQIAASRDTNTTQSLLDIGTGSGILAIAAWKLGYSPVAAFDFDPAAVRVAGENAAANQAGIAISRRDLTKLPARVSRKFDIVCANLTYDLLLQERRRILNRLSDRGVLVLAGILKKQYPAVRRAYEQAGMDLVARRAVGEWHSAAFRFRRREPKRNNVRKPRQAHS